MADIECNVKVNLSFESTRVVAFNLGRLTTPFGGTSIINHLLVLDFFFGRSEFACLSEHQLGFAVSNVLDVVRVT